MGRAACARIQNTPSIRARVASADRALKTQRLAQTSGSSIESGALWNIQAAFRAFFNEIATWRKREDSMGIDAGGAGLHRTAMEATPQRSRIPNTQKRHRASR